MTAIDLEYSSGLKPKQTYYSTRSNKKLRKQAMRLKAMTHYSFQLLEKLMHLICNRTPV
jgi:hypothetical protein